MSKELLTEANWKETVRDAYAALPADVREAIGWNASGESTEDYDDPSGSITFRVAAGDPRTPSSEMTGVERLRLKFEDYHPVFVSLNTGPIHQDEEQERKFIDSGDISLTEAPSTPTVVVHGRGIELRNFLCGKVAARNLVLYLTGALYMLASMDKDWLPVRKSSKSSEPFK